MKTRLTRRLFTQGLAALAGVSALYGCSSDDSEDIYAFVSDDQYAFDKKAEYSDMSSSSYCSVNCTPRCRLIGRVKDGRIVSVTPGELPGRPNYGTACLRGQSLPWKLQSQKHRVLYPMYRSSREHFGTMDGFEQISWERAFEILAQKVQENISTPHKIRFFQMTGNLGTLQNAAAGRFADTIGASVFQYGNEAIMSDHGGSRGMAMVYGVTRGHHDHREYSQSHMAIFWGRNVADTHSSEMQYILDAKEAGCKIVTVDPRLSSTGAVADKWIKLQPGTDSMLANAMIRYILENDLQDTSFIKLNTCAPMLIDTATGKYIRSGTDYLYWDNSTDSVSNIAATTGAAYTGDPDISDTERNVVVNSVSYTCRTAFHYLREEVFSYTMAEAASITGVPQAEIEALAHEYATNKPCGIRMGQGMQRYNYAYQGFRGVATLGAICGQIGLVGGGVAHMGGTLPIFSGANASNASWANAATWNNNRPGFSRREMKGIELYYTVDEEPSGLPSALDYTPDRPNVLWVVCSALVNQSPDYNRLTKEVMPRIPFIINQDPFFNATSPYCDLLLPTKSYWENWDYVVRSPWIMLQKPAIKPIGESYSDVEIYSGIARKLGAGYQEYWDRSDKQFVMDRFVDKDTKPGLAGFDWDEFEKNGIWTIRGADFSPLHTNFNYSGTATKKFEFYTESIADVSNPLSAEDRRQKVPAFGKPYEDPNDTSTGSLAVKYPLVFIQYHDRQSAHTQNLLTPALEALGKEPFIEINDEDAESRGIRHGDLVRMFNDRGEVVAKAHVTPGIIKGTTAIPAGWAPEHFVKGHYQELTHCKLNAVEHLLYESNFAAYDNLVQVEVYRG